MAATVSTMDDLVKDYLLFRGFSGTLKNFENDIKSDKDRGLRVERILELLHAYVTNYEIVHLREFWSYLDARYFSRLEHVYLSSVRKLEVSLFRWYVINAVQNKCNDKVMEFFEKVASDSQSQSEWRDWYALPFTKNPEEVSLYAMYFTKQWQDTFLLSLNNFLSVIFQSMPLPSLLMFDTDLKRMKKLQIECDHMRKQLSLEGETLTSLSSDKPKQVIQYNHLELVDDFYDKSCNEVDEQPVIADDVPVKGVRKFLGKIAPGSPTAKSRQVTISPSAQSIMGTKKTLAKSFSSTKSTTSKDWSNTSGKRKTSEGKIPVSTRPDEMRRTQTQPADMRADQSVTTDFSKESDIGSRDATADADMCAKPYILLSQDEYSEHHSAITHCRFSESGKHVASCDMDGVVKVWSVSPTPNTVTTVMSKASLMCFEWASKTDRLLLLGNKASQLKLFDVKEKRNLIDVQLDPTFPRITSLLSNPSGNNFTCAASSKTGKADLKSPRNGRLSLWNLKSMEKLSDLPLGPAVNCMVYNHNGQLLLVGTANGHIRLFDVQNCTCITSWPAHTGDVYTVQFSNDETSCLSLGADGRFVQWSVHQNGVKIQEWIFHPNIAGPFTVSSSLGGQKVVFTPRGRLFALDADKQCLLTCKANTGAIYSLEQSSGAKPLVSLNGHKSSVITVDWSHSTDGRMCLTGSVDGKVLVSTLLK